MAEPESKRAKMNHDVNQFEIINGLLPELQRKVLSFLNIRDLGNVCLVNKHYRDVAEHHWDHMAMKRFGLAGKEGWKTGVSYLKKPTWFKVVDNGDFGYGQFYLANPRMATNQNILVTCAEGSEETWEEERDFPSETNGICIRDSNSLSYCRTIPSPIANSRVAICGRVGCEIIVTSGPDTIVAQCGNDAQKISLDTSVPEGIPIIGCEAHLIAVVPGKLLCYKVERENPDNLLRLETSTPLPESYQKPRELCWSKDMSQLVLCCSGCVSFWTFDSESGQMTSTDVITTEDDLNFMSVALGNKFLVVCNNERKLLVFDRKSGTKMFVLCDVEEGKELERDDIWFPVSIFIIGDLLMSTSNLGNALCMWDLKTGQLLKRHTEALDQFSDDLPDGVDATSLVFLSRLNCYVTVAGNMFVWGFPTSDRSKKMLQSIWRRERNMQRVHHNLGQGEMRGDAESVDSGSDDDGDVHYLGQGEMRGEAERVDIIEILDDDDDVVE